jgi:hypothetical protein
MWNPVFDSSQLVSGESLSGWFFHSDEVSTVTLSADDEFEGSNRPLSPSVGLISSFAVVLDAFLSFCYASAGVASFLDKAAKTFDQQHALPLVRLVRLRPPALAIRL